MGLVSGRSAKKSKQSGGEEEEKSHLKMCEKDSSAVGQNGQEEVYFGVFIPPLTEGVSDGELLPVYRERKEVLQLLKKYKNARFKAFRTHEEALSFSVKGGDMEVACDKDGGQHLCPNQDLGEKPCAFKAPTPQECVKFRKSIESGDINTVFNCITMNPRYLVSSGDTPTILQEGRRFNAIHTAAAAGQAEICHLILNTVENEEFMQLMFNDDKEETRERRIKYLLDLYLNTPCKAANETPLHYAVKFGHLDVVEVLLSYPICSKDRRNKFNDLPSDVICSRSKSVNPQVKAKLKTLLEDRYYVPVLRSPDSSVQPVIAKPWSPDGACEDITYQERPTMYQHQNFLSPVQPAMEVSAYAGPMPAHQARILHRKWRTSPFKQVILTDPDRGLEAVGRNLTKEIKVPWSEYWPFLECYCDLSSPAGLQLLEDHLRKRFKEADSQLNLSRLDITNVMDRLEKMQDKTCSENMNESQESGEALSPVSQLCKGLIELNISNEDQEKHHPPYACRILKFEMESPKHVVTKPVINGMESKGHVRHVIEHCCDLSAANMAEEMVLKLDALCNSRLKKGKKLWSQILAAKLNYLQGTVQECHSRKEEFALDWIHPHLSKKIVSHIIEETPTELIADLTDFLDQYLMPTGISYSSDEDEKVNLYRAPQLPLASRPDGDVSHPHITCVTEHVLSALLRKDLHKDSCSCVWINPQQSAKLKTSPVIVSQGVNQKVTGDEGVVIGQHRVQLMVTSNEGEESYLSIPSSGDSTPEMVTPDECLEFFLSGDQPQKMDADVVKILNEMDLNPDEFPNIFRWRHMVMLHDEEERKKWSSSPHPTASPFSSPNVKGRQRSFLNTSSFTPSPSPSKRWTISSRRPQRLVFNVNESPRQNATAMNL